MSFRLSDPLAFQDKKISHTKMYTTLHYTMNSVTRRLSLVPAKIYCILDLRYTKTYVVLAVKRVLTVPIF